MLLSMKDLEDCTIRATDGPIGNVRDLYFDDEAWAIRYLVVDAGAWLSSRQVLISPIAIGRPDWTEMVLPVSITKEPVKNSPDIDADKAVSRRHEIRYHGYYGCPHYWGDSGLWGGGVYPDKVTTGYAGFVSIPHAKSAGTDVAYTRDEAARHQDDDPHLRSCKSVMRYNLRATNDDIGHVQELLVDEETWAIRYLIVNTSSWWLGHQVLIAPQWIKDVIWSDATVSVNLTRQIVKDAPPYDSGSQLDRKQETAIYKHYGRPGYWT